MHRQPPHIGPALECQRRLFQDIPHICIDLAVGVFKRYAGIHKEAGFRAERFFKIVGAMPTATNV